MLTKARKDVHARLMADDHHNHGQLRAAHSQRFPKSQRQSMSIIFEKHGWTYLGRNEESRVDFYQRGNEKIDFYYTTGD